MALEEPHETDLVVKQEGARVYLARQVAESFSGAELGWETDEWGAGFTFRHPEIGGCCS